MSAMEKVIKGMEYCKKYGSLGGNDCNGHYEYTDNLQKIIKANNHRQDCPYGQCRTGCVVTLIADAIALLKEQDVKPMIENEIGWNCPSCGMNLIGKTASGYPCDLIDLPEDEPIHFCPKCGQAVKWE